MKFQNILLFFAAATFALANSLDISDDEDIIPVTDANISSDVENTFSDAENPNEGDVIDTDEIPDANEVVDTDERPDVDEIVDSNENPDDEIIDTNDNPEIIDTDERPDDDDIVSSNENNLSDDEIPYTNDDDKPYNEIVPTEGKNILDDVGEGSDDYGDSKAVDALDAGEGSDDYGDAADVNAADAADTADTPETDKKTNQKSNQKSTTRSASKTKSSNDEEPVISYAAGVAGAAFISSAGIIFWLKKSKRNHVDDVPLRMESLA